MKWLGKVLLHPKELSDLENIKKRVISTHGPVTFDLKDSPSSGEIFTKFKELHVYEWEPNCCSCHLMAPCSHCVNTLGEE